MSSRFVAIAHPDWVLSAAESLAKTVALMANRDLPSSIEGRMVVVPVKRILRGIYGSDLRAAWMLLLEALAAECQERCHGVREWWLFTILRKDREAWYQRKERELQEDTRR